MKPIATLKPDEILVFGSNLAGRHGKGAALDAARRFGAEYGVGEGLTGQCYAIPTKDYKIRIRLLDRIEHSVWKFLKVAASMPDYRFIITPIGCGLAGYTPSEIAPMFKDAPANCILPDEFK